MTTPLCLLSPAADSWHGRLNLEFDRQAKQTVLRLSYAEAPLKVQRPFYPEGASVCHSTILHTAGGIVGGDSLSLNVRLHPHAQALVTTAAATKIYGSNGREARQTIHLSVAEGACLEWLPQETIGFNGAIYRQDLRVELASGATWLGWDITRLGRSARGERFDSGEWRSRTSVWQGDRLLWVDPQWIQGGSEMIDSPYGLAGCPVIGSFGWVGQTVPSELVEQARLLWQEVCSQTAEEPGSKGDRTPRAGVTRLTSGLLCRYRGHSTAEARRWFIQVWHLVRAHLGRSGCVPRVWQL